MPLSIIADGQAKPRKCIMVFGSYTDDVEQMAGGTFAKYIAEGYQGILLLLLIIQKSIKRRV